MMSGAGPFALIAAEKWSTLSFHMNGPSSAALPMLAVTTDRDTFGGEPGLPPEHAATASASAPSATATRPRRRIAAHAAPARAATGAAAAGRGRAVTLGCLICAPPGRSRPPATTRRSSLTVHYRDLGPAIHASRR